MIAVALLLPLIGSGVSWALPLSVLGHGTHHTALHTVGRSVTIVLDHTDADHHHDDAPDTDHSHSEEHVVTLAAADACSVSSARPLPDHQATAVLQAPVLVVGHAGIRLGARISSSGVGPPAPSRSAILRI